MNMCNHVVETVRAGKGVGCDEIWIKDVTLAVRIGRQQQQLHRRSQHQHPLLHQRPNLQLHQRKHGSLKAVGVSKAGVEVKSE